MKFKIVFFFIASLALTACATVQQYSEYPNNKINQSTDTSIKFDPQNSQLHYKKGIELLTGGNESDLRLAKVAFQIALRESPNDPDYYKALAATLQKLGDQKSSLSALLKSQQLVPKDEIAFDKIALQAFRAGYFPMSYSALNEAASTPEIEKLRAAFSEGSIKIQNLIDVEKDFLSPDGAGELIKDESSAELDQKVRVDVLLLLHEENNFTSSGMDTMGQLNLLVSGDLLDYESSKDLISGDRSENRDQSLKFSLGETINYGLNIFRDSNSTFRLETAPSVMLQEGESAEFKAISETYALTYDDDTGELDDADSFLETGLTLEMTANEIGEMSVSLDVAVSEGEITNIENSGDDTNALNTSLLTAEKIEYKTTIDIPFGPVVPLAEFSGTISDETGSGTRKIREAPVFGKLFGVAKNNLSTQNGLILISASRVDVLTTKALRNTVYKTFSNIYEGEILVPPPSIGLLPAAIAPIEYQLGNAN
jgi:tetratricopeptide (TPR) repeat protein